MRCKSFVIMTLAAVCLALPIQAAVLQDMPKPQPSSGSPSLNKMKNYYLQKSTETEERAGESPVYVQSLEHALADTEQEVKQLEERVRQNGDIKLDGTMEITIRKYNLLKEKLALVYTAELEDAGKLKDDAFPEFSTEVQAVTESRNGEAGNNVNETTEVAGNPLITVTLTHNQDKLGTAEISSPREIKTTPEIHAYSDTPEAFDEETRAALERYYLKKGTPDKTLGKPGNKQSSEGQTRKIIIGTKKTGETSAPLMEPAAPARIASEVPTAEIVDKNSIAWLENLRREYGWGSVELYNQSATIELVVEVQESELMLSAETVIPTIFCSSIEIAEAEAPVEQEILTSTETSIIPQQSPLNLEPLEPLEINFKKHLTSNPEPNNCTSATLEIKLAEKTSEDLPKTEEKETPEISANRIAQSISREKIFWKSRGKHFGKDVRKEYEMESEAEAALDRYYISEKQKPRETVEVQVKTLEVQEAVPFKSFKEMQDKLNQELHNLRSGSIKPDGVSG
ncbi:MAG: hypothetical protein PHW04_19130 [Candidatus Wallbacteria bacterium]|nr:hypothetical protein [Candidatus Wallbacteria bacterium]